MTSTSSERSKPTKTDRTDPMSRRRNLVQLAVHRIVFARGIDPGLVVYEANDADARPFHVDEVRRLLNSRGLAIKLFGHYENAPSKRVSIGTAPEEQFTVRPTQPQLQAIWQKLLDAVEVAIETSEGEDEQPWRLFGAGPKGIEITTSGGSFMLRLVADAPDDNNDGDGDDGDADNE